MSSPYRILSISHSYVIESNRRLAREIGTIGAGKWEIAAVAPKRFINSNDQRIVYCGDAPNAPYKLMKLDTRLTMSPHLFSFGRGFGELVRAGWNLIHAWEEPYVVAGAQVAHLAPRESVLVYATFQNISKRYPPPFNWLERYSMHRAAGWIAFGKCVRGTLEKRAAYSRRPSEVIPPGVDVEHCRPDKSAGRHVLVRLGWNEFGPPVIGMLGRLVPEKGISVLLSALDGIAAEWRLLIVGDGPLRREVLEFQNKYPERVRYSGGVSHQDVPAYLNAMDVLAAPSLTTPAWREQFGRMIAEAMACGVAVVGSNSGEIPGVIGDAGVVVPEGDIRAWRDALLCLISETVTRHEFARMAHERAVNEFAWSVVAAKTLRFFTRLLDQRNRGPQ